ncbi:hypothetical protein [Hyalangium sp.]|uniref:hypothetical protein n=1 Tax=Hyalangium sp. TaxID=2028555 RepID=UPI002D755495|nr:hypothetical protein [Hyalangium sp.]HYH98003.1 hypothetical protein [Hyalangium sp.]
MKRFVIVFSNEPSEPAPWIARACESAKVTYLDNDPITTEIAKNPEAQKQLLSNIPPGENTALSPHYKAALEKVAGKEQRIGLYSNSWLLYLGQAEGCVLDFSGLEAQRKQGLAGGMKQQDVDDYFNKYSKQMEERARKYLPQERILVLPTAESDAKKAELAADFIRKLA